ncbi:hypothetical protein [Streptomyces sp. NPDC002855]|uniref:hypothetical protein n=1 Tax=Streptomyces sp. NPDC002855 TaxID=3154437 RepID=UPI0033302B89
MTPAAVVLPDAAVRMPRAVAGRRALQVVLLLAGLLALGLLCGERAHAVDGAPAPARERVTEPVRERVTQPVRERVVEPVRERVTQPVRERVVEPVRDAEVEPVRDAAVEPVADAAEPVVRSARGVVRPVVDGATGVLEGAPQRVVPEAPDLPGTPGVPDLPGTPGVPGLPSAPDVPELPQPGPGHGAGAGAEPPASHAGQGEATARAHGARAESSYGTGAVTGTGNGATPYSIGQHARDGVSFGEAHRTGQEPVPFTPAPGDPARTLGGQSAGDGSSTRHGDPCAASPDGRAPVRLLQGAGAGQVSAPIRERHRDIPEFPG